MEAFILERAEEAASNEQEFLDLVRGPCQDKGFRFKYGLKIRSKSDSQAMLRIKVKLLGKSSDFKALKLA